jgi:hypothetical protein
LPAEVHEQSIFSARRAGLSTEMETRRMTCKNIDFSQ